MSMHLHRDLERLRQQLLAIGRRVEHAIAAATGALLQRDAGLATAVVDGEIEIDNAEVRLEEECLKLLALHSPVAGDLRFVITALKVDNDLERMGDAAESIALRARQLLQLPPVAVPDDFQTMVTRAQGMTQKALQCLLDGDVRLAREVLADDDAVDALQRQIFALLQQRMREDPDAVEASVLLLSATRQVERIADLATNIAEDVLFLLEGEIVRHRALRLRALPKA